MSVEIKPLLKKAELGRNAIRFRNILLKFPDFDGGMEELLGHFGS
jgi:hypothetical protein